MRSNVKVFLDTSALISAVFSDTGGSRLILQLGEAQVISLWVGPHVLQEAEAVIERKSPRSKGYFALLLERSQIQVSTAPNHATLEYANALISYLPDAQVVAEALTIEADYFVSFDRQHLVYNPETKALPFPVGTAGDFLAWYRKLTSQMR